MNRDDLRTAQDAVRTAERELATLQDRYNAVVNEYNQLARATSLTDGQTTRFNELQRALDKLAPEVDDAERALDLAKFNLRRTRGHVDLEERRQRGDTFSVESTEGAGPLNGGDWRRSRRRSSAEIDRAVWHDEPTDLAPHEAIQRAFRVLDNVDTRDVVPTEGLERVDALLRSPIGSEVGRTAAWTLVASDPNYESAFIKVLVDPQRGHLGWSDVERVAFERAKTVRRAMSVGTDTAGGFLAPFVVETSVIITSSGSVNPMRQVARLATTTSNSWSGITSAGITASWDAEGAEVSDDSPTLAQPTIDVHKGQAWVPFSVEIEDDAIDLFGELGRLMADAIDQLQAAAHVTGTGTGEPQGFVTGLDGTASELSPVTAEAFAAADVYDVIEAVPPRFRANASWLANLGTLNDIAQFETANGARLFPSIDDGRLLMKAIRECSNMASSGDINPAATADNFILAAGDWRDGYVLVDRLGTQVEIVPHVFGSNQRPTGQRGLWAYFRHGAEVVNSNALRILNVATTAARLPAAAVIEIAASEKVRSTAPSCPIALATARDHRVLPLGIPSRLPRPPAPRRTGVRRVGRDRRRSRAAGRAVRVRRVSGCRRGRRGAAKK